MNAIQITNKGLDTLRSDAAKVELDAYQYRHAGKIAEADAKDKAVAKFKNEEKATEKRIYGLATKAFIKAGFEPLVVSGD